MQRCSWQVAVAFEPGFSGRFQNILQRVRLGAFQLPFERCALKRFGKVFAHACADRHTVERYGHRCDWCDLQLLVVNESFFGGLSVGSALLIPSTRLRRSDMTSLTRPPRAVS